MHPGKHYRERERGKGGGVAGLTELVASVIIQTICQPSTGKTERERERRCRGKG